jgi:hypothetical protein
MKPEEKIRKCGVKMILLREQHHHPLVDRDHVGA